MKNLARREPAALIGLLLTIAVAVVDHFVHLTDGQWQHVVDLAPLASGIVTRFHVTPTDGRDNVQLVLDALGEAEREAEAAQARLAQLRAAVTPPAPPVVPAPNLVPDLPPVGPIAPIDVHVEPPAPIQLAPLAGDTPAG